MKIERNVSKKIFRMLRCLLHQRFVSWRNEQNLDDTSDISIRLGDLSNARMSLLLMMEMRQESLTATIETVTSRQNKKREHEDGAEEVHPFIHIQCRLSGKRMRQVQRTDLKVRRKTLGIPLVKHCSRLRVIPNVFLCPPRICTISVITVTQPFLTNPRDSSSNSLVSKSLPFLFARSAFTLKVCSANRQPPDLFLDHIGVPSTLSICEESWLRTVKRHLTRIE